MLSDIKKLIRHSATYGAGIVLGKLVGFLMLPIYTRYLTPSDYGVLQLLMLTTDIISMVIGIGITHSISRFYNLNESKKDKDELIGTTFILSVSSFSFFFIPLFFLAPWFSMLIFNDLAYTFFFKLVFFNLLLTSACEVPLAFITAQQKSEKFVTINLFRLILQLSLNIYFVVILRLAILGILYSTIISSVLMSAYLAFDVLSQAGLHFSRRKAVEVFKYGAPLIFSNIGAFIITFSDRYFLKYYANLSDVGIYSLGYKFAMLMTVFVIGPFNQIWGVQMFEIAKKEDAADILKKIFTYFSIVLITFALFLTIFSKDAIRVMANPNFWEANKVIPIIVLAYVVYGFYAQSLVGILVHKKTHYLSAITVVAGIANLVLNWLLIPRYAALGAAWATVFAFLIRFLGVYYYSHKFMPIPYEWHKIFKLVLLSFLFYVFSIYGNFDSVIISLCFNALIFMVFLIFIYKIDILSVKEKNRLRIFVKDPLFGIRQLKAVNKR